MRHEYYLNYLRDYLEDHGFDTDAVESDLVKENAESANVTYMQHLEAGYDGICAGEMAIPVLFDRIGASVLETARDTLELDFKERVSDIAAERLEELAMELSRRPFWDAFKIEDGLGLDEGLIETGRTDIHTEIDQFLKSNGI